jgi:hypothetical protein
MNLPFPPACLAVLGIGYLGLTVLIAGCGATARRPATAPSPPVVPGTAGAPDLAGVVLPDFTMPLITGGVSRPRHTLTPGAVASRQTARLCALPAHPPGSSIPAAKQAAVFREYGYARARVQSRYRIDYLVPPLLGGARTMANMWPAALKGTGYFQKAQLDHVLRDLVCRRSLSLRAAQRDLKTDWYSTWLRYVVATGRA